MNDGLYCDCDQYVFCLFFLLWKMIVWYHTETQLKTHSQTHTLNDWWVLQTNLSLNMRKSIQIWKGFCYSSYKLLYYHLFNVRPETVTIAEDYRLLWSKLGASSEGFLSRCLSWQPTAPRYWFPHEMYDLTFPVLQINSTHMSLCDRIISFNQTYCSH